MINRFVHSFCPTQTHRAPTGRGFFVNFCAKSERLKNSQILARADLAAFNGLDYKLNCAVVAEHRQDGRIVELRRTCAVGATAEKNAEFISLDAGN